MAQHRAARRGRLEVVRADANTALDTFETEPLKDTPLAAFPQVQFTPHLGASTKEAQEKAGLMVAEQVRKVLAGEKAEFRVV